jgi:hypothetical protein
MTLIAHSFSSGFSFAVVLFAAAVTTLEAPHACLIRQRDPSTARAYVAALSDPG